MKLFKKALLKSVEIFYEANKLNDKCISGRSESGNEEIENKSTEKRGLYSLYLQSKNWHTEEKYKSARMEAKRDG